MVLGPLGDAVEAVGDAARSVYDGVTGTVASVFGSDPSGNDGGSSVWEAWGHPELYSMVRDTVSPGDIQEGAAAYHQVGTRIRESFDGFVGDLEGIVQGGWRGQSAEAATGALAPLRDWSGQLSAAVGQTGEVMGASGESAEQARRDVPEPVDFNAAQTLRSAGSGLLSGGPAGALLGGGMDAVAQERAQDEARAEAVRVMNTSYSPPLLEGRDSVPEYPRPINPTTVAPEAPPIGGPSLNPGGPGGPEPSGGGSAGGLGGGSTGGQSYQPYQQPGGGVSSPAASSSGPVGTGGQAAPGGLGGSQPPGGGPAGAGGPVSPGMAPVAGGFGGTGSGQARPGARAGGAGGAGGAMRGGGSRGGGSAGGGFGPRGSGGGGSAAGGPGGSGQRPSWSSGGGSSGGGGGQGGGGQGAGGAAAAAGRAGGGAGRGAAMPFGALGAGRGPGGEDSEHQRKILIEADRDAIVGQLDAVAPPVIGEDPDVYQRDDHR